MPVKSLPGNVMKKLLLAAEQRKANAWQCQEENWMLGRGKWETALCALRFIANISFLFLIIQRWDEPQPQNVFGTRGQLIYFHLNQNHDPGTVYTSGSSDGFCMLHQLSSRAMQGRVCCTSLSPQLLFGSRRAVLHLTSKMEHEKEQGHVQKGCTPLCGGKLLGLILGDSALCSRGGVSTFFQKVSPTG